MIAKEVIGLYKIMLVDDEPEICEGLKTVVDLPALGFELAGEARNGMEGLRLAEKVQPDVVISDIRMPIMDGLTMAQRMKKTLPTTQFVFLSGYDDFEYARTAIELSALRYVLKPVTAAELRSILGEVKRNMDDTHAKMNDVLRFKEDFEASLPLLRETLLSNLLRGNRPSAQLIDAARRYGMDLEGAGYQVALIALPDAEQLEGRSQPELLPFAVANIASEVLQGKYRSYVFNFEELLAILIVLDTGQDDLRPLEEIYREIVYSAGHYLGCGVQIGASNICGQMPDLFSYARQARDALDQARIMDKAQVVFFNDIVCSDYCPFAVDEHILHELELGLKTGNTQKADESICRLLDYCVRRQPAVTEYHAFLMEVLTVFLRARRDMHMSRAGRAQQQIIDGLLAFPAPEKARAVLMRMARDFINTLTQSRMSLSKKIVQQAMDYVEENYHRDDTGMETLCKHLHISASYFSAVFKKETQSTFVQYLTRVRMEKALALIASGDHSNLEISQIIGIKDPSYFSFIFKKHFGVSPSEMRKRENNEG